MTINRDLLHKILSVMRPQKYFTFVSCIAGSLIAEPSSNPFSVALKLCLFFVSFAVLTYTGIYLLNDLADYSNDRYHPVKRKRPIASGKLSKRTGAILAVILILSGIGIAFAVDSRLPLISLSFVLINIAYSWWLKRIRYVDLLMNSVTHPLRVLAGVVLFGELGWAGVPAALCIGSFFLGTNSLKRHLEIVTGGAAQRPVLRHYTARGLRTVIFAVIPCFPILLIASTSWIEFGFVALVAISYTIVMWAYWAGPECTRKVVHFGLTH